METWEVLGLAVGAVAFAALAAGMWALWGAGAVFAEGVCLWGSGVMCREIIRAVRGGRPGRRRASASGSEERRAGETRAS